jgi:hypothetical protein
MKKKTRNNKKHRNTKNHTFRNKRGGWPSWMTDPFIKKNENLLNDYDNDSSTYTFDNNERKYYTPEQAQAIRLNEDEEGKQELKRIAEQNKLDDDENELFNNWSGNYNPGVKLNLNYGNSKACDDIGNLARLNDSNALEENYRKCCPKSYWGYKNSSPYCKQVDLKLKGTQGITSKPAAWYEFWKSGGKRTKRKKYKKSTKSKKSKKIPLY